MCGAIKGVECAEVTHAVRSTRMNRYTVKEGDIIGILDKRIVAKGTDVEETALATIKKVAKDKDMVSVYFGKDVTQEQADRLMQKVEQELDDVETACYYGGQPHYYYIISAE